MVAHMIDGITSDEVRNVLREIIAIDSVNHNLRENRSGEADLCDWLEFFFQRYHIPYQSQPVRNRQRNLIARIEGRDAEKAICFEAHLDTTTARGMAVHPFGAEEVGGAIYGRGACDAKGPLAAMLVALKTIRESDEKPPQTILLAATVDKEVGKTGIQRLLTGDFRPAAAIVGAPTNLAVARACRGCVRWRIVVGESPQSYAPASRNAITDAVAVLEEIIRRIATVAEGHLHPLLGKTEIRPCRIRATSIEGFLPPHCAVDFECYTVPGFDADSVLDEVNDLVCSLGAEDPTLKIAVQAPFLRDPAAETPESSPLVAAACDAARSVLGAAETIGLPENSHYNRFNTAGIPAIAFGPGDPALVRSAEERVPIDQLAPAALFYFRLMRSGIG